MLTEMHEESDPLWEAHKKLMGLWKCDLGTRCKANRRHRDKGDSLQQWCYVMKDYSHISLSDADLHIWARAVLNE
jgi:hypothetical protein